MPLVVDTYNVLQVEGVLPPEIAGIEVGDLVGLIRESRYRRRKVVLVCDGFPPPDGPPKRDGSITVVYSGRETADDVIARIVTRSSAPRRLFVVTSDREVLRDARRRRCGTIESAEFLGQLADDHRMSGVAPPPASVEPGDATPPADVLQEAEALERSLRAEIALMEEEIAARANPPERADDDAPSEEPEESPLASLLPSDVVEEAEALEGEGGHQDPGNDAPAAPPPAGPARQPVEPPPDPGPDPLPRSIIEEADRLWRDATDGEPPPHGDETAE